MQKPLSDPNIFQNYSLSDPWIKWPISQLKKRTLNMSGIDFARSDLSPGLLCELVVSLCWKTSLLFKYQLLKYSQKLGGGALLYNRGYGCESGIFKPLPLCRPKFRQHLDPLQTNGGTFSKIYTVFPRFTAPARFSIPPPPPPPPPIRLQLLISARVWVSVPPSDKRLLQISLNVDQKDGEPELFLINWQVNH